VLVRRSILDIELLVVGLFAVLLLSAIGAPMAAALAAILAICAIVIVWNRCESVRTAVGVLASALADQCKYVLEPRSRKLDEIAERMQRDAGADSEIAELRVSVEKALDDLRDIRLAVQALATTVNLVQPPAHKIDTHQPPDQQRNGTNAVH